MNKKLLLSIGSVSAIAAPIILVVSCGDTKQMSLFNLKSDAEILLDAELAKRDVLHDDDIRNTALFVAIEITYNNAIKDIHLAKTIEDIKSKTNEGIQKIKDAIIAYTSSDNLIAIEVKKTKSLIVVKEVAQITSDQFFKVVEDSLLIELNKNQKLLALETTIDKSVTTVNEDGKVVVKFKTSKTGNTIFTVLVTGFAHGGLDNIQFKTLVRLFADGFGYNHVSIASITFKYTLTSSGIKIILENINGKWMLTENRATPTDVTTDINSSPLIGSEVWGYIQVTLLKKIKVFDLSILKEINGLPGSSETINVL